MDFEDKFTTTNRQFRREQAQMVAQMKGVPLEFGDFGVMPYYKKVPQTHRVRCFQLGKLKRMLKDIEEEKEVIHQRAEAEGDAVAETLGEAEIASALITAAALSNLADAIENPTDNSVETATVADALSSKRMDEVDELETDLPALQTHAAQLAANQAADGASAGSAEFPVSAATRAALQRRAKLAKISPRPLNAPMEAVPEEQAQPSET
eukprot:1682925-Amphidinium_carterae.1